VGLGIEPYTTRYKDVLIRLSALPSFSIIFVFLEQLQYTYLHIYKKYICKDIGKLVPLHPRVPGLKLDTWRPPGGGAHRRLS
jgi:hypothetical protein